MYPCGLRELPSSEEQSLYITFLVVPLCLVGWLWYGKGSHWVPVSAKPVTVCEWGEADAP